MAEENPTQAEPAQEEESFWTFDGQPSPRAWRVWSQHFRARFKNTQSYVALGQTFTFVTARQVQDRLDATVGIGNWQTHYSLVDETAKAVECTITIFGVSKTDVGYPNTQGQKQEAEALKSAYSDAFKRAAVQWGIGRYLYGDGE